MRKSMLRIKFFDSRTWGTVRNEIHDVVGLGGPPTTRGLETKQRKRLTGNCYHNPRRAGRQPLEPSNYEMINDV